MPVATLEVIAGKDMARRPIVWRLGRLFNVVTNIRRARITEDYAFLSLTLEGSTAEIAQATDYLRALNLLRDAPPSAPVDIPPPETGLPITGAIHVKLTTVTPEQGQAPTLYRLGKDYNVIVNLERGAFDTEEGGSVEITISGPLPEVQRAIAYLHTTGIHVNPRQRSVTDFSNL